MPSPSERVLNDGAHSVRSGNMAACDTPVSVASGNEFPCEGLGPTALAEPHKGHRVDVVDGSDLSLPIDRQRVGLPQFDHVPDDFGLPIGNRTAVAY